MRTFIKIQSWLMAHRGSVLRKAATLVLIAILGLVGRALIAAIRAPQSTTQTASPELAMRSPPTDSAMHAAAIVNVHLFGTPAVATQAVPVMAGSDVTLAGILYSTSPENSRAIVVVGGDTVVGAKGTRLSNGAVITSVLADRILINDGRGTTAVLLDIKKADPNARFETGQSGSDGIASTSPGYAPMSQQATAPDAMPTVPVNDTAGHQITHAQFLPMSALRGKDAASHFAKMRPPVPIDVAGGVPVKKPP